jgi:nucleotide-binding universal stress UspA family protein
MKTILVGVDGSAESKAAAEFAANLAQATSARLLLAFAIAPIAALEAMALGEYLKVERDYGEQVLREMEARCSRPGLEIEKLMLDGDVPERLGATATKRDADLIVVGHRGRGAVQRVLLGSSADRLVQTSPRPVLVVR